MSAGYAYCAECDGEGRIYNNADPTSGQYVECECAERVRAFTALLMAAKQMFAVLCRKPGSDIWPTEEEMNRLIVGWNQRIAQAEAVRP